MDKIFLSFVGIWLIILSLSLYWIFRQFQKLTKGKKGNLIKILGDVLKAETRNKKEIERLTNELKKLEDESSFHIQKVGLVRFNPFKDLGGDHSFSIALLDGDDSGVVLTGLHTRERTRIYVKAVKKGKSEYELSEEEKKAVTKAKRK